MGKRIFAIATIIALGIVAGFSRGLCTGICQGCYCDCIINDTCFFCSSPPCGGNCEARACVGCVGACVSGPPDPDCVCQPGVGACGWAIYWCRDSDCAGTPVPTPTPLPTPTPTPPPDCTGEWIVIHEPAAEWAYQPPYPIVVGQDPTARGFDLLINAHGGWAEKRKKEPEKECDNGGTYPQDCPDSWHWVCVEKVIEHYDDPLVEVKLTMDLAQSSRAWITELAQRYPGAHFKEKLPWEMRLFRGETMSIFIPFRRYPASDPGWHVGDIILKTRGTPLNPPQTVSVPYRVPVHLLDTTIIY